jgi:hypothetical protein
MVDGRWSMVDGRWSMVDGRWSMVDGRWSMVDGRWSTECLACRPPPNKVVVKSVETPTERDSAFQQPLGIIGFEEVQSS